MEKWGQTLSARVTFPGSVLPELLQPCPEGHSGTRGTHLMSPSAGSEQDLCERIKKPHLQVSLKEKAENDFPGPCCTPTALGDKRTGC